ncbi:MAG: hypothetical protein FIA97_04885 [Methylococcaceae bacterium]|nr:hypothetical protein [Methylococcaceae bacterium]
MNEPSFKKIPSPLAAPLCADIELDEPARQLLQADPSPAAFLARLMEQELFTDAVRFLARALPPRESTWWACLCVRTTLGEDSRPEFKLAVEAAERWVYTPSEENRRLSYEAAQATNFDSPAAWTGMAAFWSGGSMAPPDVPVVPPAENLTSKAVSGAVMLSAVILEPEKAPEKYRTFLEQGIDIANGGSGRLGQKPAA